MGLFGIGSSSPFDADVEKATNETNTAEQWDVIIDICDKVGSNSKNAKDCLRSIMKRMAHNDPHVAIQAITLLDACVKNCGKKFHLEIASRDFETEFRRLLTKVHSSIALKMRISLKKWAENEFKSDAELNLIPTLYDRLKKEGFDFVDHSQSTPKQTPISKDPNVVSSQQEEDDIAKAIELSLKENGGKITKSTISEYSSLYPSMSATNSPAKAISKPSQEAHKVRALYDFEAAEDNELTFNAGEIIYVLDDTDKNWWKGYNDRGEGLFPSNFVSADLSAEPESTRLDNKSKKSVQFDDEQQKVKEEAIEIDESKIDRLLHLLHEANPEDPSQDSTEMFILEQMVNQMLPLIDTGLERVDRNHAKLTQLSSSLVEAINMYHMLMRDSDIKVSPYGPNVGQQPLYGPPGMINSGLYGVHGGHHSLYSVSPNAPLPQQLGNTMSIPTTMIPGYGPGLHQVPITHTQTQPQQMMAPHGPIGHPSMQNVQQHPGVISQPNQAPGLHNITQANASISIPPHLQQTNASIPPHLQQTSTSVPPHLQQTNAPVPPHLQHLHQFAHQPFPQQPLSQQQLGQQPLTQHQYIQQQLPQQQPPPQVDQQIHSQRAINL